MTGIEPASLVWKTMTLPLSYIRIDQDAEAMTIPAFSRGSDPRTCIDRVGLG